MKFQILSLVSLIVYAATSFASEKIVVIGGGLAGLSAAYRLQQMGRDVELYEARNRVGGRVLSVEIDGHIAELGGQSINDGGEALSMRGLIAEMGLDVTEHHFFNKGFSYFEQDSIRAVPWFPRLIDEEEINAIAKSSRSMGEMVDALIAKEDLLHQIVGMRFAAFEGAVPEKLAPLYTDSLLRFLRPPNISNAYILSGVMGGNGLLPLRLAGKLGGRVHLGHPLTAVEKKDDGSYLLVFADGKRCKADILVLAMPCSVYEDISFGEGVIPPETLAAILDVRYGTNAKILVPFKGGAEQQPLLMNRRAIGYFDPRSELLTVYYTGEASRFSEESIEETYRNERPMVMAGYGSAFPQSLVFARDESFAVYEETIVGYSWPSDPYVKGSYSYIAPGQEPRLRTLCEVNGEWVKELFLPIDGTLYFAGEHATILLDVPGTMEAASESGERAARMVNSRFQ